MREGGGGAQGIFVTQNNTCWWKWKNKIVNFSFLVKIDNFGALNLNLKIDKTIDKNVNIRPK